MDMIKFKDKEFVGGQLFTTGMMAEFDAPTEAALIASGDAEHFQVISRPAEVLSSSAVPVSCVSIAIDEILASFTIAAGTLGVNSILQIEPLWTFASSANNKICKIKVGAFTVYSAARTASVKEGPIVVLANRNSLTSQIQPYVDTYVTAGVGAPATYTIDFSVDVTVQITGQRAANEALTLEYYRVLHFVGE
jgi:hypothetical protein